MAPYRFLVVDGLYIRAFRNQQLDDFEGTIAQGRHLALYLATKNNLLGEESSGASHIAAVPVAKSLYEIALFDTSPDRHEGKNHAQQNR